MGFSTLRTGTCRTGKARAAATGSTPPRAVCWPALTTECAFLRVRPVVAQVGTPANGCPRWRLRDAT